ncbi:MAG: hypothetical protein LAN64_01930 [Acidobacteriia bacterium]|nr:hypothetical protein [Terriglobia bacterium]
MAPKKKPREHVNTKWLLRRISANLTGVPSDLREMVLALYVHSNTFLEADDVRNGWVQFTTVASQDQLAAYCHLSDAKGAYRRLVRLQNLEIVDWDRGKRSNGKGLAKEYFVTLDISKSGVQKPDAPDIEDIFPSDAGCQRVASGLPAPEGLNRACSVSKSGVSDAISGVHKPDTAFSAPRSVLPTVKDDDRDTEGQTGETPEPPQGALPPEPPTGDFSPPDPPAAISCLPVAATLLPPIPQPPVPANGHDWSIKASNGRFFCGLCGCGYGSPSGQRTCRNAAPDPTATHLVATARP